VLGAYLVWFPNARVISLVPILLFFPLPLPAWLVLGTWFVVQAVYSLGTGMAAGEVAYVAHLAGFVVGLLFALALGRGTGRPEPRGPYGIGTMR
jgi:membrane associated rhomboid family serine protease